MIRSSVLPGLAAILAFTGSAALAQAPAGAMGGLGGPTVPGVCVLSREAVFANAKVGKAATARLQELSNQVQTEIDAERKPLEVDLKTLDAQKASLTPAQLEARGKPLTARWEALQHKAALRTREIEATRIKALDRISNEAQLIVGQVYSGHNCGMLLDRQAMLGGNAAADLTPAVVQGLDAKITTITFPRETLAPEAAATTPKAP
uniref:Outer membrane chaperone Skp (OmpH) n=1 Tax=Caulobacter sp. (strain K31) TaxID=366602 RepID=B0T6Z9_CAUSK